MAMNNPGGGEGGPNQQAGEQAGGQNSHISYVKHLSSDQAEPGAEGESGGGLASKIPGGWWTVGIGLATIVIGIITINVMRSNNNSSTAPSFTTGSQQAGSADTSGSIGGALDPQLSGILSQEQINNQVLQSILTSLTPPAAPKPPTSNPIPGGHLPTGGGLIHPGFFSQVIFPWAKGTHGKSGAWTYTTQAGDTVSGLNLKAGWGTLTSGDQAGNNIGKYRNNASILQQIGVTNMNQGIPIGTKISL